MKPSDSVDRSQLRFGLNSDHCKALHHAGSYDKTPNSFDLIVAPTLNALECAAAFVVDQRGCAADWFTFWGN